MAEFASKGVAGSALGLAIGGLSAALLNNDGDGLLGGILGGGSKKNEKIADLMAENTLLKGRSYTDAEIKGVTARVCGLEVEQAKQGARIDCLAAQMDLREKITDGKIQEVALTSANGIDKVACGLDCLRRTVDGIASTYVPAGKVTPLPAPNPFPPVPPYSPYPYPYPFPPFPFPPAPPLTQSGVQSGSSSTGGAEANNG